MREIKFRAWDGEQYWYNVVPSPIPSRTLDACTEIKGFEPEYDNEVDIISGVETIEQYTGLKDKNGKEIYEGDIVSMPDWRIDPKLEVVKFTEGACGFEPFVCGCWECLAPDGEEVEVVGNIHENPELLEGGRNR